MSGLPDGLSAERHRDLAGRAYKPWIRRGVLAALVVMCGLALANLFGQQPTTSVATEPAASLALEAPPRLRSGLIFEGEIEVRALRRIAQPRIVLGRGWVDGITINTVSPEAADQAVDAGRLVLAYGELPAGDTLLVHIEMQVNPTTWGRMAQDVELRDGDATLARVARTLTIFP